MKKTFDNTGEKHKIFYGFAFSFFTYKKNFYSVNNVW